MPGFSLMVACTPSGGIGNKGKIPWYLPTDLRFFQKITSETVNAKKQNAIIMGRKTWESLPKKPLANRRNVILSRSSQDVKGIEVYPSLTTALSVLSREADVENVFVIGGGQVFTEALAHPGCQRVYLTLLDNEFECDAFFPVDMLFSDAGNAKWRMENISEQKEERNIGFTFIEFTRLPDPHSECQLSDDDGTQSLLPEVSDV